jgi:hypothetical protein
MKFTLARSLRVFAKVWYALVALLWVLMQVASCERTGALMDQMSLGYILAMVVLLLPGLGADYLAGRLGGGAKMLTRSQILRVSLRWTYLNSADKRDPVRVFLYRLFPLTYLWLRRKDWVSELWITEPISRPTSRGTGPGCETKDAEG